MDMQTPASELRSEGFEIAREFSLGHFSLGSISIGTDTTLSRFCLPHWIEDVLLDHAIFAGSKMHGLTSCQVL